MFGKPKSLEELFHSNFPLIVPGGYSSATVAALRDVPRNLNSQLVAVSRVSIYDDVKTVLTSYAADCAYDQWGL